MFSDVCAKIHDHWVDGWGSTIRPMSARVVARHGSNPPAKGQFSAKKPLRLKKLTIDIIVRTLKNTIEHGGGTHTPSQKSLQFSCKPEAEKIEFVFVFIDHKKMPSSITGTAIAAGHLTEMPDSRPLLRNKHAGSKLWFHRAMFKNTFADRSLKNVHVTDLMFHRYDSRDRPELSVQTREPSQAEKDCVIPYMMNVKD